MRPSSIPIHSRFVLVASAPDHRKGCKPSTVQPFRRSPINEHPCLQTRSRYLNPSDPLRIFRPGAGIIKL